MGRWLDTMGRGIRAAAEMLCETLWTTRCVLCDTPGESLCDDCMRLLAYVDWWRACPRCGAPYGKVQCCECNPIMLEKRGIVELPFAGCASAVCFDERSGTIVRTFKDQGELQLAHYMGGLMARCVSPAWSLDAIAYIPASKAAFRRRGFDHAQLLADVLSQALGLPVLDVFARPTTRDQRALSRTGRALNLRGRFSVKAPIAAGSTFLLVDDVYTTGSTLCAATNALLEAGAGAVYCVTFARVV